MTRVAVIGPGAVGGAVAATLARLDDHEVTLVARAATADALRKTGLHVSGTMGDHALHLPVVERLDARPDVVVVAVKTQDLDAALAPHAAMLRGALVILAQNGLAAELIAARHLPPEDLVGCVVSFDAEMLEVGRVRVGRVGGLTLGGPRAAEAHALLSRAGWPSEVTADLAGARWMKLLVNLNNALAAVRGESLETVYADGRVARVGVRMLREGLAVAQAEGARLVAIPYASPALVALAGRLPEPLAARVVRRRVRQASGGGRILGSTLQSLRRHRATEVAHLNGEVVARGARHGVPTPINAWLCARVEAIAAQEAPFASADEVAATLSMARRQA